MKRILLTLFLSITSLGTLLVLPALGQYYPGGMRSGMGGMGGGMAQQTGPTRPVIPNIAGNIANKETKWLKDNLSLDKEQAKAVKKLNNEYADQQQDAIKDIVGPSGKPGPETGKQIQDMMLMLNEEKEDRLKTILTPDQWKLYQSKKGDMQKEVGGYRPPAPKEVQAKTDSASSTRQ